MWKGRIIELFQQCLSIRELQRIEMNFLRMPKLSEVAIGLIKEEFLKKRLPLLCAFDGFRPQL